MFTKEYVACLIGLYKNNGAVLYVGNFFPHYLATLHGHTTCTLEQGNMLTLPCYAIG